MPQSKESKKRCSARRKRKQLCRDCPNKARLGKVKCDVCFQKDLNRQKHWTETNYWKKAANHREKTYGIKNQIYCDMFYEQNGRCGICDALLLRPHLDHDHKSGEIRGILCPRCNTGLAFLESTHLSENAKKYLEKTKTWQISKKQLN